MNINSSNNVQKNTINQLNRLDQINRVSSGEYVVSRVAKVQEVTPGFNATTLYLAKLYKELRNKNKLKKKLNGRSLKGMPLEEFREFFYSLKEEFVDEGEDLEENLSDHQLLYIQDLLSAIDDEDTFGRKLIKNENKSLSRYDESYNNLSHIESNGMKA